MKSNLLRRLLSTASIFFLLLEVAWAQSVDRTPQILTRLTGVGFGKLALPYQAKSLTFMSWEDSPRLDALLRGDQLHLSLSDAVALALENNLDIELQRYAPRIAESDLERARAGSLLRGVPLTVREGPVGVGGPVVAPPGTVPTVTPVSPNLLTTSVSQNEDNLSIVDTPLSLGSPVPSFDPVLIGLSGWQHQDTPETSFFLAGTNPLLGNSLTSNFSFAQGMSTGTLFNLSFNNFRQESNSSRVDYNPYTASSLAFTITQPLLQGFGPGVNRRFIRIAKNNEKVSDLLFRQQAITTVAAVVRLYWDLVSLREDLQVKRQALELAQKLYSDNKNQVEVGTLPPIELVRAQAQVASSQQDLINAESLVEQQEVVLKNFLSRKSTADKRLAGAHIVPTDQILIPDKEPEYDLDDLAAQALQHRPDLASGRVQVENTTLNLKGTKNALLPSLDLVGSLQNNGLAGVVNPRSSLGRTIVPAFIGGYGDILSQLFRVNYPNYGVGVQLNVPLRNRSAQADVVRDQVVLRQSEIRLRELEKQVRVEVESALIALRRARASYEAAVQTRVFEEKTLAQEEERYKVGASTSFFVIQDQRDLAQARSAEVVTRSVYVESKNALDLAIGRTLEVNNITLDEAYRGQVSRPPREP